MSRAAPVLRRLRHQVMEPIELIDRGSNLSGNFSIQRSCSSNRNHDSYHMSVPQLDECGPGASRSYTMQTERDRRVLGTDLEQYACGMDIKFKAGKLHRLNAALVQALDEDRRNAAAIRELIYTIDGVTVLRWDAERDDNPKPGEADRSHLWHTHVSIYRDAVNDMRLLRLFVNAAYRAAMIDAAQRAALLEAVRNG